jgi:hypothetical protein
LLLAKQSLDEAPYKLSGAIAKLASITFSHLSVLLLIDKPWFLTEGKDLLLWSSYFPLGVSQLSSHNHHQLHASHQALFWRRCRGKSGRPLQGEFFRTHILYFVLFVLLYFIYFYLHRFIKNPKKLESFVVVYYV